MNICTYDFLLCLFNSNYLVQNRCCCFYTKKQANYTVYSCRLNRNSISSFEYRNRRNKMYKCRDVSCCLNKAINIFVYSFSYPAIRSKATWYAYKIYYVLYLQYDWWSSFSYKLFIISCYIFIIMLTLFLLCLRLSD